MGVGQYFSSFPKFLQLSIVCAIMLTWQNLLVEYLH